MRGHRSLFAAFAVVFVQTAGCFGEAEIPGPCGPVPTYPAAAANPRLAADAGPDQEAKTRARVMLDGSASLHVDGKNLTYHWDQLEGPCVTLDARETATPSFNAPPVPTEGALLKFQLIVQSEGHYSNPDEAEVLVTR